MNLTCDELMTPMIVRDLGEYPGCRPELNVRRTELVASLSGLRLGDPIIIAVWAARESRGCTWGGKRLWPVTDDEVTTLMGANAAAVRLQEAAAKIRAEEDAIKAAQYAATVGIHICPKCGTFCEGDCCAN